MSDNKPTQEALHELQQRFPGVALTTLKNVGAEDALRIVELLKSELNVHLFFASILIYAVTFHR